MSGRRGPREGARGPPRSPPLTCPASRPARLSEAFDKITEVWSTDVLSKKNDVHKILEGLRKHVDASAAQVTPLPEHVNRALGDLLDRVNMALPNGRQTDILEANEIVEQVLALIEVRWSN